MSARVSGSQVHFLSLQTAIFCVQCELISANSTPCCLACGSKAVLGLSRVLGGSLRAQPSARVIEDAELNRLVRELLHTLPAVLPVITCAVRRNLESGATATFQSSKLTWNLPLE